MPKLRRLSGKDVLGFCEKHNFKISQQRGSHINMVRIALGVKQVVTIPNHKELDRGTLHGIYRKLSSYIVVEKLKKFFYTD